MESVMVTVEPPFTAWSWASVMAKVWLWAWEDDVAREIPPEGGVWTSDWVNVTEWV
jgi:hypothetical protein